MEHQQRCKKASYKLPTCITSTNPVNNFSRLSALPSIVTSMTKTGLHLVHLNSDSSLLQHKVEKVRRSSELGISENENVTFTYSELDTFDSNQVDHDQNQRVVDLLAAFPGIETLNGLVGIDPATLSRGGRIDYLAALELSLIHI